MGEFEVHQTSVERRDMRTLSFIVKDQSLTKDPSSSFDGIVAGTKGYLKARFNFNSTWRNYFCVAVFRSLLDEYAIPIKNGECEIPAEAIKREKFYVRIVGQNTRDGSRITTTEVEISQIAEGGGV